MLYLHVCMYCMLRVNRLSSCVIITSDIQNFSDWFVFPQNLIVDKINEFKDVQFWL